MGLAAFLRALGFTRWADRLGRAALLSVLEEAEPPAPVRPRPLAPGELMDPSTFHGTVGRAMRLGVVVRRLSPRDSYVFVPPDALAEFSESDVLALGIGGSLAQPGAHVLNYPTPTPLVNGGRRFHVLGVRVEPPAPPAADDVVVGDGEGEALPVDPAGYDEMRAVMRAAADSDYKADVWGTSPSGAYALRSI